MSSSSAAFFCEYFAGTVSVFAAAPSTARAPLTNAAFGCGWAVVEACELGSSLPILPDGVCCAFSCCERCCASVGGDGCWAPARPALPANTSAKALAHKSSRRIVISFARVETALPPAEHYGKTQSRLLARDRPRR